MKKILFLFSVIALLCGCHEIVDFDQSANGAVVENEIREVFYASMADEDNTRTYVDEDGSSILWHNGDELSFFGAKFHNLKYVNISEDGASTAEFHLVSDNVENDKLYIELIKFVYPYNETTACIGNNGETLVVDYPAEQTYRPNSFGRGANVMVSAASPAGDLGHIYFRNACGYFIIKLNGEGETVKSIKLTAKGGVKIAGKAHIVANENVAPVVTMTDEATSTVTLNCGEGVILGAENTEFWFALPPVTFEQGLEVEITDGSGNVVTKSTSKQIVITRNEIQPMAAFAMPEKLYYTRESNTTTPVSFYENMAKPFDTEITAHYYDEAMGKFVIAFNTPVTKINDNAFRNTDISTISIPGSVTTIGKGAFENCDKLTSIIIPSSVKAIGKDAFYDCDALKSAVINSDAMGSDMFDGCGNLASVTIGGTVSSIDGDMFDGCSKLSALNITGSVNTIEDGTFDGYSLTSLDISGYVGTIGANAFDDCDSLVTLNITGKVDVIGDSAFEDCDSLVTVNVANTVDRVGAYAFSDCDAVISIAIPANTVGNYAYEDMDGLKIAVLYGATVGEGVFYDSDALEDVTFDGSVNTIGLDAFYSCGKIKRVTFLPSPTHTDLKLNYQKYVWAVAGVQSPFHDSVLEEVNINRNLGYTLYDEGAEPELSFGIFSEQSKLTKVTLGEQVKIILPYTFAKTAIESITLPKYIELLGDCAFAYCENLKTVIYTGNVPAKGANVYYECGDISHVYGSIQ